MILDYYSTLCDKRTIFRYSSGYMINGKYQWTYLQTPEATNESLGELVEKILSGEIEFRF